MSLKTLETVKDASPLDLSIKQDGPGKESMEEGNLDEILPDIPLSKHKKVQTNSTTLSPIEKKVEDDTKFPKKEASIENLTCSSSVSTVTIIKGESETQEPIQMIFNNGNFVEILPKNKHFDDKMSDPTELKNRPKPAHRRDPKKLIKTTETLTNTGALFCTFRNFNQNKPKKVRHKKSVSK